MPAPSRFPLRHTLAAALLLGAAACADQPTTPATPGTVEVRRTTADGATALSKPVLHPNRQRYSYHGQRPATGRSGSASLSMQALVGRDGRTEVELSTGNIDEPWWGAPGTIVHAQTKASSPDGEHMFTRKDNHVGTGGRATMTYDGLSRGAALQVQANVKDIDPHRTDVVTVTGTVLRRPNLAVAAVDAPSRARVGTPINVAAVIRETNGDVGNWGSCSLYADGVRVDWAYWVWVDAGDAVTCAFTYRLRRAGPVRMEVRVETASGALRDDDPGDNAAETVVDAIVTNEILYSVSASDVSARDSSTFFQRWRSGAAGSEQWGKRVYEPRYQQVRLSGSIARSVSRSALRLEVSEMTGGATIIASTYDLSSWYTGYSGSFCDSRWDWAAESQVYLCSSPGPDAFTSFTYQRYAGSAVYHSYEYSRTWDGTTSEEYVYTENRPPSGYGLNPLPSFGDDFAMRVRLHDGEEVFTADPVFPLTVTNQESLTPYECFTFENPEWDYFSESCRSFSLSIRTLAGSATG